MPGMSGPELALELRARGFDGPIVLMSAYAHRDQLEPEFDAFLPKPFTRTTLGTTLRRTLDRREPSELRRSSL